MSFSSPFCQLRSLCASDMSILRMFKGVRYSDGTAALRLIIQCLAQGHFSRVDVDLVQEILASLLLCHENLLPISEGGRRLWTVA